MAMKPSHILGSVGAMRLRSNPKYSRTATGIVIGSAHTRPPPLPSDDAEKIQAALLLSRRANRKPSVIRLDNSVAARLARWLRRVTRLGPRP